MDETRRNSFDRIVAEYARARPAAPPELFDAIADYVPPPADLLEIGCGPGTSSVHFLERGYRVHAVELGENLAQFARERLAGMPFTVEVGKFEDAKPTPAGADLVASGAAFHWLELEPALTQVARALRPGGGVALFWGSPRRDLDDPRFDEALREPYRVHAPQLGGLGRPFSAVDEIARALAARPEFEAFEERRFPQTFRFDARSFVDVLGTFSDHATLDPAVRARLFADIAQLIDTRFGGQVERHVATRLLLARRRA